MVPAGPRKDRKDDGVEGPQMHVLRLTPTETTGKLVLDFSGISRGTEGPADDRDDERFADGMVPEAAE